MNSPITITRKLELTNIFVVYKAPQKPAEYPTEWEFTMSLQSQPLMSIASIHIPLELGGLCSLKVMINWNGKLEKWNVRKGNQPFFNFSYDYTEGFLDKFWKELENKLAPSEPTGPTSELMM